jgi:hypothetical protein
MPRHKELDDEQEDDSEDEELSPGDDEEISNWTDLEERYDFLDGLDYLDDIFDYPEDEDWYDET